MDPFLLETAVYVLGFLSGVAVVALVLCLCGRKGGR